MNYIIFIGVILFIQIPHSGASSILDVWSTLASTFVICETIYMPHKQLKQWNKLSQIINEYFQGLSTTFDQLTPFSKLIDHEDQVEYISKDLLKDYKSVIYTTNSHGDL